MANFHFWIGFVGILMYAIPMYWSGITQALMWKQFTPEGILQYPNFLETLLQIVPMHMIRATGGMFFYAGVIAMVYNLVKTIKQGSFLGEEAAEAPALDKNVHFDHIKGFSVMKKHRMIERKPLQFTILAVIAIIIGGLVEVIPTYLIKSNIPTIASVKPYSPLELQGRDIYIREACNSCHSQLVRPFRSETERYGEYSKAGEYVYDHPFLWGSKRTGPDLHRIGKKYPNLWHYLHMDDPTTVSPGSLMPKYSWLKEQVLNIASTESKINAMRTLGVPYEEGFEKIAAGELEKQANEIAQDLQKQGIDVTADKEIIALIAYLQRLGTDIKNVNPPQTGK
jgi:cytochrome c oxidase cbb3-type subunit I/II